MDLERGKIPAVQPQQTGRIYWHNISISLTGDADLDRLQRQIDELTAGRVNRDLLRMEISGSLSLAGHSRYKQMKDDLNDRLLRLRIKGECQQTPEAEELEQLTARVEDPLIARVANQLQQQLQEEDPESEQAAINRAALCELFRFTTTY